MQDESKNLSSIFNGKNVINNESLILNELVQNSAQLFNIQKYKLYVDQTEQV
jgi:hypothetical protein